MKRERSRPKYWIFVIISSAIVMVNGCGKGSTKDVGMICGKVLLLDQLWKEPQDHSGIEVKIEDLGISTQTSSDGSFILRNVPPGRYSLRISKEGYRVEERKVIIVPGGMVKIPKIVLLDEEPTYQGLTGSISGKVLLDSEGHKGTKVRILELEIECETDEEGVFKFSKIPTGVHTLEAQHDGYVSEQMRALVEPSKETPIPDLNLEREENVEEIGVIVSILSSTHQTELTYLIGESSLIIVGKVISVGGDEIGRCTISHEVYQDAVIRVEGVLKSVGERVSPGDRIMVRRFGGEVGKFSFSHNAEMAPFIPGERVLLLLSRTPLFFLGCPPKNGWVVMGERYGRFRITKDGRLIRPGWKGEGAAWEEETFDLDYLLSLIKG